MSLFLVAPVCAESGDILRNSSRARAAQRTIQLHAFHVLKSSIFQITTTFVYILPVKASRVKTLK